MAVLRWTDYKESFIMSRSMLTTDTTRILRHIVAAIAYRASRSLRDPPSGFETARLAEDGMSARELILHMTNVTAFALATVTSTERVRYEALDWKSEIDRFYGLLGELDARLAEGVTMEQGMELKLVQGPLSDALTHIGQLNALRRKAGAPIAPANYIKADIQTGRTALKDQPE
jgi:hypothetical protein